MNAIIIALVLMFVGSACVVAGVFVLLGLGHALLASGSFCLIVGGLALLGYNRREVNDGNAGE